MNSAHWQKNLYTIAIAQFLVLSGFTAIAPFMPLMIQKVGNFTNAEAVFWTGVAIGGGSLSMFLFSPLWGIAADRWGRKPMLLRAQFGGAILMALMAIAPDYPILVLLRIIQGALTGTVAAALALVSSQTPKEKLPFAMGILMAAVFSGSTLGPLYGGFMADHFGFETTLLVIAGMLMVGGLIVIFLTTEKFEKPVNVRATSLKTMWQMAISPKMLILLTISAVTFAGPQIIAPVIPLTFKEIDPDAMAASQAGMAFGLMGLFSVVSSLVSGRIASHIPVKKMLIVSCLCTGLLFLPPVWAATTIQLILFIGLIGLFQGGLQTSTNTMISMAVTAEQQGLAFGLVASVNSLGMGIGSFFGGGIASLIGMRPVFGITAGLYLLLIIFITRSKTN